MSQPKSRAMSIAVIVSGTIMVSSAAVWIRFLPQVNPIMIGLVRVTGAALVFLPFYLRSGQYKRHSLRELRFSIFAGIALGLHFAAWITSLSYTSVAQSVLLVDTHPMFVIGITIFIYKERIPGRRILGAILALVGILIIQGKLLLGGVQTGSDPVFGNFLALAGGFFVAIYFLLGQSARQQLSTLVHAAVAYSSAAVTMGLLALISRAPLPPAEPVAWGYLALLILIPTLGGHTIFNWGLRHLGAPVVSLLILLEPIESAYLAWVILDESVPVYTIVGGAVVLCGLLLSVWERGTSDQKKMVPPD